MKQHTGRKRLAMIAALLITATVCTACSRMEGHEILPNSNIATVINNAGRNREAAQAEKEAEAAEGSERAAAVAVQNTADHASAEDESVPGPGQIVHAVQSTQETTVCLPPKVSFDTSGYITVDREAGRATYDDGIVTFSWDITKYYVTMPEGEPPMLTRIVNGCEMTFRVFRHEGIADDLTRYATNNMVEYLDLSDDPYWWARVYAIAVDTYFAERGYFGIHTGYDDTLYPEDALNCNLLTAHSFSDGKNTALVTIRANGFRKYVAEYEEAMYVDHVYQPVLENLFEDVIASFSFSEAE